MLKLPPRALVRSMKFLSLEVALYLCNSTIKPIGINLVDVHLNWLKWFHFLILEVRSTTLYSDRLILIFLSPFLDFIRMSLSIVPFLSQLNSGFLCLWNAFPWPIIWMALTLFRLRGGLQKGSLYQFLSL